MPGVPLDDELLAVLSVGVPVGLGIYLGLGASRLAGPEQGAPGSRRQSQARSPAPGSGSTRPTDLLALVTAIAGATAGANLLLILLDVTRARPAGDPPVPATTVDAPRRSLEPATPTGAGRR